MVKFLYQKMTTKRYRGNEEETGNVIVETFKGITMIYPEFCQYAWPLGERMLMMRYNAVV